MIGQVVPFPAASGGSPAPAPTFVASANFDNVGASSVAIPGTIFAGDVCIMWAETFDQAMPTPTGASFAAVTGGVAANAGTTRGTLFEALLTGSETSVSYGDSGDHQIGQIYIIRGSLWVGGTAFHKIGTPVNGTGAISLPGFTTTEDNCLCMGFVCEDNFGSNPHSFVNADLTGVATIPGYGSSAGNNGAVGTGYGTRAVAGAVGAMTASRGAGASWAGVFGAIR